MHINTCSVTHTFLPHPGLPRFVKHVDEGFLAQVTELYRQRIPPGAAVLVGGWVGGNRRLLFGTAAACRAYAGRQGYQHVTVLVAPDPVKLAVRTGHCNGTAFV